MIGVNLSGAEFGGSSGTYGKAYIYPSLKDIQTYADQGVDLIRLPFKWERMQPTLGGALDPAELGRLEKFLDNAQTAGVKVILDLHNYGRYDGHPIGDPATTSAQFADFWSKLSSAVKDQPALAGYDLMNEPHDMGGASRWPTAAQAAVDAIRKVDTTHAIYVEGDGWATAATWQKNNANLHINDPVNKIVYEAHAYFDHDNSGTYKGSYDAEKATPDIGVDRLQPFVDWLHQTGSQGFIGEFSVPNTDPRWLTVLDNFLTEMNADGLSGTYWGAGPWWGKYPEALMNGSKANPQLAVLLDHLDDPSSGGLPSGTQGTAGADTMNGTAGHDVFYGLAGDDHLLGRDGDDVLAGGAGNDTIEGGKGADLMVGGTGDDYYLVDSTGDVVREAAGEGTDTVGSSISYTLPDNVENLTLRSTTNSSGTGNALANVIVGNGGTNAITGGGGADTLTGGGGADRFVFTGVGDSHGTTVDTITDFTSGVDRLDLSRIDANTAVGGDQAFRYIGTAGFDGHAGEVRATVTSGHVLVEADVNGDHTADFALVLSGTHLPTAADFVL